MIESYRRFPAGPDPFGRSYDVRFLWQQTAISIRHADTVDVKWELSSDGASSIKVVALPHPDLLKLSASHHRALTDAWCMRLAALHLQQMILTGEDMEKTLVTVSYPELERYAQALEKQPV
jgi:hypothetical protein